MATAGTVKRRTAAEDRGKWIKLIHVARRDLAMDEASYRAVVRKISNGRTDSSADCTLKELSAVLAHLKACGFKIKPKAQRNGQPASRALADDGQSMTIRALWLELHDKGYIEDASEQALAAFCKRMTKVEALQWLKGDQASKLIEDLKQWLARDAVKIAKLAGYRGSVAEAVRFAERLCEEQTGQPLLSKAQAAAMIAKLQGSAHE